VVLQFYIISNFRVFALVKVTPLNSAL
jgi:hypothetical protein